MILILGISSCDLDQNRSGHPSDISQGRQTAINGLQANGGAHQTSHSNFTQTSKTGQNTTPPLKLCTTPARCSPSSFLFIQSPTKWWGIFFGYIPKTYFAQPLSKLTVVVDQTCSADALAAVNSQLPPELGSLSNRQSQSLSENGCSSPRACPNS